MLVGFKFWCETNNYNKYQITTINLLHYWIFLSFFKIGNNPMVVKTRLTKTLRDGSLSIDLVLAFGTVLFRLSRFGSSYGKCARDICLCTSRLSFRLLSLTRFLRAVEDSFLDRRENLCERYRGSQILWSRKQRILF